MDGGHIFLTTAAMYEQPKGGLRVSQDHTRLGRSFGTVFSATLGNLYQSLDNCLIGMLIQIILCDRVREKLI